MKYPVLDLGAVNAPLMPAISAAIDEVVQSGRYVGGPVVEAFEEELAAATGTPRAVGVSNGLDAMRLIFKAYIELGRLSPGDAVIVPANTYVASFLAITDAALRPVPVEPDPVTLNMDTTLLEAAYTPDVKAVLTVHLYGRACYDAALRDFVGRHNLLLVEDNAQAIGADGDVAGPLGTARTGALGNAAAFSFYPTKNVGAFGDAGAVTSADADLLDAVRALANYGSRERYNNIYKGYNCRLDPVQAAVLRVKLAALPAITAARRRNAAAYQAAIDNEAVTKPLMTAPDRCVWHQYVVRVSDRAMFRNYLAANGVGTDVHYPVPPHRQKCYAEYSALRLPVTERLADTVVSLPISEALTPAQIGKISRIINSYRP